MQINPNKPDSKPTILSRILRLNLSMSPSSAIDSIFLPACQTPGQTAEQDFRTPVERLQEDTNEPMATQTLGCELRDQATDRLTPTPTRTPTPHSGNRLIDVKRLFTTFARFGQRSTSSASTGEQHNEFSESGSLSGSASSGSDLLPTPPASPGILDIALAEISTDEPGVFARERLELLKVREGKRPERPIVCATENIAAHHLTVRISAIILSSRI